MGKIVLLCSGLDTSIWGMYDGRVRSMSIDWDQRRMFKSPHGQEDFEWCSMANNSINIINYGYSSVDYRRTSNHTGRDIPSKIVYNIRKLNERIAIFKFHGKQVWINNEYLKKICTKNPCIPLPNKALKDRESNYDDPPDEAAMFVPHPDLPIDSMQSGPFAHQSKILA